MFDSFEGSFPSVHNFPRNDPAPHTLHKLTKIYCPSFCLSSDDSCSLLAPNQAIAAMACHTISRVRKARIARLRLPKCNNPIRVCIAFCAENSRQHR